MANFIDKIAVADLFLSRLSEDEIQRVIQEAKVKAGQPEPLNVILVCVLHHFEISEESFMSKSRKANLVKARQFYSFLVISILDPDYLKSSRPRIATYLRRDIAKHMARSGCNVNNLIEKVRNYAATDRSYREELQYLEQHILSQYEFKKT